MKKISKKIAALLTTFSLLSGTAITAMADDSLSVDSLCLERYVDDNVPYYLAARDFDPNQNYSVSSAFPIIDLDGSEITGYYFFVFCNNKPMGKIEIHETDGEYNSCYNTYIPEKLAMMYEEEQEIAIVMMNGITYAISNEDCVSMDTDDEWDCNKDITALSTFSAKISPEREVDCSVLNVCQVASSWLGTKSLSVSFVENEKVNNKYVLCWAACVAMGVNYVKNTSYSASDIMNIVGSSEGYDTTIVEAYDDCSCPVTEYSRAATPTEVFNSLDDGKPVHISVADSDKGLNHSVEIISVKIYNDKTAYTFYDPSIFKGTKQTVVVECSPTEKSTGFVYTHTYDNVEYNLKWKRTYIMD